MATKKPSRKAGGGKAFGEHALKCGGPECPAGSHPNLAFGLGAKMKKTLTPDQLDDRTDSGKSLVSWIGRKVRLRFGPTGTLVRHKTRKFGVLFEFGPCRKCGVKSDPIFAVSGPHAGAWCYVYNAKGEYLGNMRDDNYICGCQRGLARKED